MNKSNESTNKNIPVEDSAFISSKRIKQIAKEMMKEVKLDYKSSLDLEEFTSFINENFYFKHYISKSLKAELWTNEDYFITFQDTTKIVPSNPKFKQF